MKLLFLVDQVDYPFAPNPVLARRTAGQLAAMGHMVHLLELYDGQTLPPDPPEGCRAFLLPFADERKVHRCRCGWPGWPCTRRRWRLQCGRSCCTIPAALMPAGPWWNNWTSGITTMRCSA